jgi:hypothetical protein
MHAKGRRSSLHHTKTMSAFFKNVQPISFLMTTASILLSLAATLKWGGVRGSQLKFYQRNVKSGEYYRLVTCLLYHERLDFGVVWFATVGYLMSSAIESKLFRRQPISFIVALVLGGVGIIAPGIFVKELRFTVFSEAFGLFLMTWFSQEFSNNTVDFGPIGVRSVYLPLVYLGFTYAINGQQFDDRMKQQVLGMAVGLASSILHGSEEKAAQRRRERQQRAKQNAEDAEKAR